MYYKYCIESRDLSLYTETIRQFYANFYGFYFFATLFSLFFIAFAGNPLLFYSSLTDFPSMRFLAELRYKR